MDESNKDKDELSPNSNERDTSKDKQDADNSTDSYYYSYGPYRSEISSNDHSSTKNDGPLESSQESYMKTDEAELNEKPITLNEKEFPKHTTGSWEYGKKKSGFSFKSIVASFLVGALVVGSLMFASDRLNLFTSGPLFASVPASAQQNTANSNGGGGNTGITNVSDQGVIRPNNIASIAKQASPAVVKIVTYVKQSTQSYGNPFFNDPFFRQFFGNNGSSTQPQQQQSDKLVKLGLGSGFIFDKSGYILTNEHVVDGAAKIEVTVEGYSKPFIAKKLGSSYDLDLAVLKITNDKPLPTLPIDPNDNNVNVGNWVVAIGNPYGFDHTVTVGVLSAKERPIDIPDKQGVRHYKHLLQTDASINPGNSGGPLLNLQGQVVGINTAVSSQAQGIGFAIPTSTITSVLNNLKNDKPIPKTPIPFIGVGLRDIPQNWVSRLGLNSTDGSIITQVLFGSPAYKASLKSYDVIVAVNGKNIKNSNELVKTIQGFKVGDKIDFSVIRVGKKINVTVTLSDKNTFSNLSN